MELLPLVFASGWASGINAWGTVLVLGVLGRFSGIEGIPAAFQRTDVLIVVAVLCAAEVIVDKIPLVNSAWDAIATYVRPVAGAAIGVAWATGMNLPTLVAMGVLGGAIALASHAIRDGLRLAVNATPQPFTNVAASVAGDVAVTGIATLIALAPVAAAIVAALLLAVGVRALNRVAARAQEGRAQVAAWRARRRGTDA
ncbi:MAG: DUF4126 domain-containing protein [Propioniciclava sp.]|uniref:DUF4126 domain-containing protein n=1 Tax=Propioniciclava sp. TaxID=2038686 RepID=UPI0039E41BF1